MQPNSRHEISYVNKVDNKCREFYACEILKAKGYGLCIYSELEGNQIRLDWFDTKEPNSELIVTYNQLISLKHGFLTSVYELCKTNTSKTLIRDITWKLDATLANTKAIKNNFTQL